MEARKITIVTTNSNNKEVIMSSATTLGELKADMREKRINYEGMTFYEGLSKTELTEDASLLPHDIPYKGTTTNELVFMLTTPNKKIKSGAMTRAEAYDIIRKKNLGNECMKRFGQHFTRCKTVDLIKLVESVNNPKSAPKAKPVVDNKNKNNNKNTPKPQTITEKPIEKETPKANTEKCNTPKGNNVEAALQTLVTCLVNNDALDREEANAVMDTFYGKVIMVDVTDKASPYSDKEIDNMFRNRRNN